MNDTSAERRAARLAAALRENLKRRKQQARGRQAMASDDPAARTTPEPHKTIADKNDP